MVPNARFKEFIKDITPSATTNKRSQEAHLAVRNVLEKDLKYKSKVLRTFLGGSYRRGTAIRPKTKNGDTERPDVDIYVVVEGEMWSDSPEELIDELYAVLNRHRNTLNLKSISRNRCSISLSTNKADMDVSPLLERQNDNLYRIGNRNTDEWYRTDPEAHTQWSVEVNQAAGERFNPMVRMVKWNRREKPTINKHPKSIALEALVAKHMDQKETYYGILIRDTFSSILEAYEFEHQLGICPTLDDPAVPGGDLLSGVSAKTFSAFYEKVKYFHAEAEKALKASDNDDATQHWRNIFGIRFPSGTTATNNASMLREAATVTPLTFPASAAVPPNKPAEFA